MTNRSTASARSSGRWPSRRGVSLLLMVASTASASATHHPSTSRTTRSSSSPPTLTTTSCTPLVSPQGQRTWSSHISPMVTSARRSRRSRTTPDTAGSRYQRSERTARQRPSPDKRESATTTSRTSSSSDTPTVIWSAYGAGILCEPSEPRPTRREVVASRIGTTIEPDPLDNTLRTRKPT
jgi:hypothetical protein